jgi:hypothetical protein
MGLVVVVDDISGEVDTSPPGADPDSDVSFEPGEADARDEVGDPARFSDEPFDVDDPEADVPRDDEFVDFGNVVLEDTTSHERWLQSALKALVEPTLAVDGALGTRTRAATKAFQRRVREFVANSAKLSVDGIAGPQTIAALEAATGTTATATREDEREEPCPEEADAEGSDAVAAPPPETAEPKATPTVVAATDAGGLTVREQLIDDATEYTIASGDDTVSFRYWTPDWNNYKPYNVSRYKGARRNLLSDAQILAAGYSRSELGILKANAMKESGGVFGAINTWDDQIVSWGMAQFAGHAGTLAALLAELKEDARSARSYQRWFIANGIDVAYGKYPYKDRTATGWHIVVRTPDGALTGDAGWQYVRTQPRLIGAFLLAGNDPAIALGQVLFWRRSFLSRAIRKVIGKGARAGAPVLEFLTAERSLAVIVRLYNWMPAYVVKWCDRFLGELATEHAGADVYDPDTFDAVPALETAMVDKICAERKRVKSGSYDTYALDLSRARGSFVAGAEPKAKSST